MLPMLPPSIFVAGYLLSALTTWCSVPILAMLKVLTLRPKVVYYLATTYTAWPFLAARQFICFVLRHQIFLY